MGGGSKVSLRIQSDPVDCCILACVKGLYRDVANGIMEGACGPLLIHIKPDNPVSAKDQAVLVEIMIC